MRDVYHTEIIGNYKINIIQDDDPIDSPRDWDNLGTMICFHRRYTLGDKHNYNNVEDAIISIIQTHCTTQEKRAFILKHAGEISGYSKINILRDLLNRNHKNEYDGMIEDLANYIDFTEEDLPSSIIALPLYLYDHSGITISTGSFSCPWDSGQVGFIYAPVSMFDSKGFLLGDHDIKEDVIRRILTEEVKTYDQYLTGNIYGYKIVKLSDEDLDNEDREDITGEELDSCWGFYGSDYCLDEARRTVEYFKQQDAKKPEQLSLNL